MQGAQEAVGLSPCFFSFINCFLFQVLEHFASLHLLESYQVPKICDNIQLVRCEGGEGRGDTERRASGL